jgi:putative addiction module component (TIGR02574 family)
MPVSLEALGIDRMSREERIALVQAIRDSIAAMPERPPLSEALRQELDRRLADHLANPQDVVPWEQVEAEALARMKR